MYVPRSHTTAGTPFVVCFCKYTSFWKIIWIEKPYGQGRWVLYNLKNDPLEQNDLASKNPLKLKEMIGLWNVYEEQNGVIIDHDLKLGYSGENFHFGQ